MAITRKTCLITGCSEGGMGAALAQAFNDKGYHVFATARTTSKIPEALRSASNVTILALDVTSSSAISNAASVVRKETGGALDVLINNAGATMSKPALDASIAEIKSLFDLNFFGAIEMIQVFRDMLVKAKGCIVNNASIGGVRPLVFGGSSFILSIERFRVLG
jgi:1-acylglycerone phosphate reductase